MRKAPTPEEVMANPITFMQQLDDALLDQHLERINNCLGSTCFSEAEKYTGREVVLRNVLAPHAAAISSHYRAAGWKVAMREVRSSRKPTEQTWDLPVFQPAHLQRMNCVFVFCLPTSSYIGKKHPPKHPEKVYANPNAAPHYVHSGLLSEGELGEHKHTSDEVFVAELYEIDPSASSSKLASLLEAL